MVNHHVLLNGMVMDKIYKNSNDKILKNKVFREKSDYSKIPLYLFIKRFLIFMRNTLKREIQT